MEDTSNLLKNYFIFLEKQWLLWENLGEGVDEPLNAIESLADQLQAASSIDSDVLIKRQFPNLEERIIFKTFMSLEQELVPIINIIKEIGEATERLNKLASAIDQRKGLKDAIPATISFCTLLECVSDSRQYYQAQYAGLQIALKCLDLRERTSIRDLRKSFSEDGDLKKHLHRSLLFGKQFISIMDNAAAPSSEVF